MLLATLLVSLSTFPTVPDAAEPVAAPATSELHVDVASPVVTRDWERMDSVFSYDYVQAGIVFGDAEGFGLDVSKAWKGPWFVTGRFNDAEVDFGPVDGDLLRLSGGLGYVRKLDPNLDVVVTGQLEYADADPDAGDGDDDLGIRVRAGSRYLYDENIELFGGIQLYTTFDSDFVFDVGGLYHFEQGVSAIVQLEHDQDDVLTVGVRYNF